MLDDELDPAIIKAIEVTAKKVRESIALVAAHIEAVGYEKRASVLTGNPEWDKMFPAIRNCINYYVMRASIGCSHAEITEQLGLIVEIVWYDGISYGKELGRLETLTPPPITE